MITLLNDYYRIDSRMTDGGDTLFGISLLPGYNAYKGHFPGNPVSPGVCNIQLIKECAEKLAGRRLFLAHIAKCRFSAVMTPHTTPHVQLRMQITEGETCSARATLSDDTTIYLQFKGEFTTAQ
jgi:3-hydroxyacyl-[acyl-carrier-protein] dehydratase